MSDNKIKNNELKFISFKLDNEEFAVEVNNVKEIIKLREITPVPRSPEYLLGIINLRGSIVPILDPRNKLKIKVNKNTDNSRIIIISNKNELSGILVDSVNEVLRVNEGDVEPPPKVTNKVDKFYLKGMIKKDSGKRVIMYLNIDEVLNIEGKGFKDLTEYQLEASNIEDKKELYIEEDQFVSFYVGDEEFCLDIDSVKEILKLEELTVVPNVPDYVIGIQSVRNSLLPVIDMRRIMNISNYEQNNEEFIKKMNDIIDMFVNDLEYSIKNMHDIVKLKDYSDCELNLIINSKVVNKQGVRIILDKIDEYHKEIHQNAKIIIDKLNNKDDNIDEFFNTKIKMYQNLLKELFDELYEFMNKTNKKAQRVIVVEVNNILVGLLVDKVSEVLRISKNKIDSTPYVIANYGKELKSIAKLDEGKRLIMILDEKKLISSEDVETISNISKEDEEEEKNIVKESQFVIFKLDDEEFGVSIDRVKEIFKYEEITPVPKTLPFIKGITNLRGKILPVIDIKIKFKDNNAKKSVDNSNDNKILVLIIKNKEIGILVDSVQEVLNVKEDKIESTPQIVATNVDSQFIEGIAKLNEGERIVILLNIDDILTKAEFNKVNELGKEDKNLKKVKKNSVKKELKIME